MKLSPEDRELLIVIIKAVTAILLIAASYFELKIVGCDVLIKDILKHLELIK